jgi:hypothetical protein
MAYKNRVKTWLTEDILNEIGGDPKVVQDHTLTITQIVKRKFSSFSTERIGPLFITRKLGLTTVLLWFCWLTIGIGTFILPLISRLYGGRAGAELSK